MNAGILFAVVAILVSASATAQTIIGEFGEWTAYRLGNSDGKTCLAASQPIDSKYSQTISGRDPAFFVVRTIPDKDIRNEPSAIAGYPFADGFEVRVEVDETSTFTMFTHDDTAWFEESDEEAALVAALQKGDRLVVTGKSRRGTTTTDLYSLAGVTAALKTVTKECP